MLNNTVTWLSLTQHAKQMESASIASFFTTEEDRLSQFSIQHEGITYDASKALMDKRALDLLLFLCEEAELEQWRDKMFAGEHINNTEDRAVLHTALRANPPRDEVENALAKMQRFCENTHKSGKYKDIVNIGIGGSDLGPRMVYHALKEQSKTGLNVHYVANIDGHDLKRVLGECTPETTLFIVASKTFTTIETLTNAHTAKNWVTEKGLAVKDHFIALSTNMNAVNAFGIEAQNMFPFEEWVGGRFSLWSSIGLSLALGLGFEAFSQLLEGARNIDEHFKQAPLKENIPVLMGLTGLWHDTFLGFPALACLPYDQRLEYFPLYLQQLDMESNGKAVTKDGFTVSYRTGPVVFGQPGTNGQHAFYQHLHQSPMITPCEFIGVVKPDHSYTEHHKILLSNMIAQSQALMLGKQAPEDQPYRAFSGNRPNTTLLLPELTPYHLGQLIALYEHKIFVQGILWQINSFDQWGVELGKVMAKNLLAENNDADTIDPSTAHLKRLCKI